MSRLLLDTAATLYTSWVPEPRRLHPSACAAVLALVSWAAAARPARAHTLGLSMAEFEVKDGGAVEALFTFASAEPLGGLLLDRDHDGVVTGEDVLAARDDLRAFLLQGVEVDADGSPCPEAFRDARLTEADGLVLEGSFACPSDAAEIEVTLYYLSGLPRGHREVARIAHGSRTAGAVLTGDHRALALALREPGYGAVRNERHLIFAAIAAGIVGLVFGGARTWRAMRAAWQNRAS